MHPLDLGVVGPRRPHQLDPVEHPQLGGQPDGQVQPDRVERVVPAQVVAEERLVPDDGGLDRGADGGTGGGVGAHARNLTHAVVGLRAQRA
ncbi:hypothetical protein GCM10010185_09600 [Saccharothrix coeruleofusca]|uniref:Uncharacterized protein n=1 Tax=Saccharothrix coeruleofusca TaxID=33919 RepID=A0A918AGW0_9PSEU|nr:hypothetical protein GCM10010185_09600 [Saccharothrix coeruleofusca]